mgnify:FL=1
MYIVSKPCLLVESEQGVLVARFVKYGERFSLHYTHSVQRTPVTEIFVIDDSGSLRLISTIYRSFGVGLPFLADEGSFRIVDDQFILEDINRIFPTVQLRAGPEARLVLEYAGETIPLYQMLTPGSFVQIRVGPYYSRWMGHK